MPNTPPPIAPMGGGLHASRFRPHPTEPGKYFYPFGDNPDGAPYFSADLGNGYPRYGGMPELGGGETFEWTPGDDRAWINTGWMSWGYWVRLDR